MKKHHFILKFLILSFLLASNIAAGAESLEKVSLQLNWKYQFEYAGFIAAKEKGFYKAAGLDVDLIEYQPEINIIDDVLSQTANYGIHNSSVVIKDNKIVPITLIATYFHRSPLVLVTHKSIKLPRQLLGKTVMGTKTELANSSIGLLLKHFDITNNNTRFIPHTFNTDLFIENKVDAITAFRTNELYKLDASGIEYNVIDPADYGFIASALNVFTSRKEAIEHTQRTQQFIQASNKGWEYALAHPEEIIALILKKYSSEKSIEALRYEVDVTRNMMLLDFFPIGKTSNDLSQRAVQQFTHSGILDTGQKLDRHLFKELIKKTKKDLTFSNEQIRYMENKKEFTMCVDPNWMPFEKVINGQHIGIAADIINNFKKKLPIPIHLVETNSWDESIFKTKARECDFLSLAASTPDRLKYMDFTSPHLNLPLVMATTTEKFFIDNISSVKSEKLGVVKGYAAAEILRKRFKDINIVDVKSISDGLERVEKGELYGYIDNLMVIANSIQKDFTGTLKISARLEEDLHLAIGTRNDEPQLHAIFEKLVTNINQNELQLIFNKWVSVKNEVAFDYSLFWKVLFSIFLIGAGFLFHYLKLRKLNTTLIRLSSTDQLTGISNRFKMNEVLKEHKANTDRYETDASIILLDIDFFKEVNDRFGHPAGDAVLVEFANIIRHNIRSTDHVARWGGEEFLIACPNIDIIEAEALANKMLLKIRNHAFSNGASITTSAGVSVLSKNHSIKESISNADKALYESKENGRDQATSLPPCR